MVAISFYGGSSQPRDQTCVFCIGREILYLLSHQGNPRLLLTLSLLSSSYVNFRIGDGILCSVDVVGVRIVPPVLDADTDGGLGVHLPGAFREQELERVGIDQRGSDEEEDEQQEHDVRHRGT